MSILKYVEQDACSVFFWFLLCCIFFICAIYIFFNNIL